MQKVLIVAVGVGALAAAQPALAVKKRICQTTYVNGATLGWKTQCGLNADWQDNNCKVRLNNGGIQYCYDADLPPAPTMPWQGSASGYGQAIQQQKTKRAN